MSSIVHYTIVVGKAGSGKSTFAKSLGATLDLDQLVSTEFGGDFGLYRSCSGEKLVIQDAFCARIRELLPRVSVVEGSVRDFGLIRRIFAGYTWRMIYVMPSSCEVYAAFVLKRFMEEPGYARVGWLSEGDPDGKMLMLKNAASDHDDAATTLESWVRQLAKSQYAICQQLAHEYMMEFPDNMSVHTSG